MSLSETVPPVQNRSPDRSAESAPRSPEAGPVPSVEGALELESLVLEDPFASSFTPDPFPAQAAAQAIEPAPTGTVFERYQKLFAAAESARDHESAILAALDSAILGVPISSTLGRSRPPGADASERTPHRPRLRSFNFERDLDWSEEPPKVREHARPNGEAPKPSEPPTAPAPLASEIPVVFERQPERTSRRFELRLSKRKLVAVSVAAALVVGFTLGFVTGRGEETARGDETPSGMVASPGALPEANPGSLEAAPAPVPASLVEAAPPSLPTVLVDAAPGGTPGTEASAAENTGATVPAAPARAALAPPAAKKGASGPATIGFDQKTALLSLSKAGARAGVCVPPGEPGGSVVATVTFGRKGHVEDVALSSATFRGAYSSDCIKGVLSSVRVRPFLGESVTVRKTLTVR